jgi:hypothetical protein
MYIAYVKRKGFQMEKSFTFRIDEALLSLLQEDAISAGNTSQAAIARRILGDHFAREGRYSCAKGKIVSPDASSSESGPSTKATRERSTARE